MALFCPEEIFKLKFAYNDDDDDTTTNEIDTPPLLWCLAFHQMINISFKAENSAVYFNTDERWVSASSTVVKESCSGVGIYLFRRQFNYTSI